MQRRVSFKEAYKPGLMKWKIVLDDNGELYQVLSWNSCHKRYTCVNIESDETEVFTPSDLTSMYFM